MYVVSLAATCVTTVSSAAELEPWAFALLTLASYRCARLVASDALTDEARAVVYRWAWSETPGRDPAPRANWRTYVYGLVSCWHCMGVWAAAGAYTFWQHAPEWRWVVVIAAVAGAQSLLASIAERLAP